LPAVKGAVGALIPVTLHERFDKAGGSFIKCDGYRVSVFEAESLVFGRLGHGMFGFFLKLLSRCASELSLSVSVGSMTVGKLILSASSGESIRHILSGLNQEYWDVDEVKKRRVLLLPVPAMAAEESQDWMLVVVRPIDGSGSLGQALQLQVTVYDCMRRTPLVNCIGDFVQALLGDKAGSLPPKVCEQALPECLVATQRLGCVLGVIVTFVQEHAHLSSFDRSSLTFISDMFAAFRGVFAKLRHEFASRSLNDIRYYVVGDVARNVLSMFGEVSTPRIDVESGSYWEGLGGWIQNLDSDGSARSGVASSLTESFDVSSGSFSLPAAGEHVAVVGASSIESLGVSLGSCSSSVLAVPVNQTVSLDAASCGNGPRRSSRIAASLVKRTDRLPESSQIARSID